MYEVLRHVMLNEKVKRDGEMIRRILARDPAMKEQAEKMGINLDTMVSKQIGGYRRNSP
jgi:hypothetical protein